jgi:hypothetical protein
MAYLAAFIMRTRHNLPAYDEAGLEWHHIPVAATEAGAEALEELLALLRRETRRRGAIAIHGDRYTDFVAAACAAHLHEHRGVDPAQALARAAAAGLSVTDAACALLGVRPGRVEALREAAWALGVCPAKLVDFLSQAVNKQTSLRRRAGAPRPCSSSWRVDYSTSRRASVCATATGWGSTPSRADRSPPPLST